MVGDGDELALGFNFELFVHTTRFFGQKVVLLGCYNGQKLEAEPEVRSLTKMKRLGWANDNRALGNE